MTSRTHLAGNSDPIVLRDVSEEVRARAFKPVGFWYQVDRDWERWATEENFAIGQELFDVELKSCNVLVLDTLEKLDAFNAEFNTHDMFREYIYRMGKGEGGIRRVGDSTVSVGAAAPSRLYVVLRLGLCIGGNLEAEERCGDLR